MKLGLFLLLMSLTLEAQGPVPRAALDLKIVEASGKTTMLSAFRGRIVLLAFISTQCAHCQRASIVFEQLWHEFGGNLQVAEVAFDPSADTVAFFEAFRIEFPRWHRHQRGGARLLGNRTRGAARNAPGGGDRPIRRHPCPE